MIHKTDLATVINHGQAILGYRLITETMRDFVSLVFQYSAQFVFLPRAIASKRIAYSDWLTSGADFFVWLAPALANFNDLMFVDKDPELKVQVQDSLRLKKVLL